MFYIYIFLDKYYFVSYRGNAMVIYESVINSNIIVIVEDYYYRVVKESI